MRRREGARARRERRQRAEARLRLRLVRDVAMLVAHRGGPRFGSQSKWVKEGEVQASVGALPCLHTPLPTGRSLFETAGCLSLAVSSLAGHDGLDSTTFKFLLAQSLAPRAQELSNVESVVSTSSQFVPEESVEQRELSTPEVRWQWYRAHPSGAPNLCRFPVALPGVAGSASLSVDNLQSVSQLLGQPVVSLPVPEGKKPIASVSKSSQQIVDSPAPKVVKKET